MGKDKQVNVRVDDEMAADINAFAEEHDLSDAEAMRRFASRGRIEYGYGGGRGVTLLEQVASQLFQIGFILGLAFLMLTFLAPLYFLYLGAAGAFMVAGVAHIVAWFEPEFTDNLLDEAEVEAESEAAPEPE